MSRVMLTFLSCLVYHSYLTHFPPAVSGVFYFQERLYYMSTHKSSPAPVTLSTTITYCTSIQSYVSPSTCLPTPFTCSRSWEEQVSHPQPVWPKAAPLEPLSLSHSPWRSSCTAGQALQDMHVCEAKEH